VQLSFTLTTYEHTARTVSFSTLATESRFLTTSETQMSWLPGNLTELVVVQTSMRLCYVVLTSKDRLML